jgi:hypothetical protein
MKYLKTVLVVITGLLSGLILHGIIEILAIWILINWLNNLFWAISWSIWLRIHFVFSIIIEIIGVWLVFQIHQRYKK